MSGSAAIEFASLPAHLFLAAGRLVKESSSTLSRQYCATTTSGKSVVRKQILRLASWLVLGFQSVGVNAGSLSQQNLSRGN
jgi:hypothetical protein